MRTGDRYVGEQIELARVHRGWTQDRLAVEMRRYGVHWRRRCVSKIERGERSVLLTEARPLVVVLGVSVWRLCPPLVCVGSAIDEHIRDAEQRAALRLGVSPRVVVRRAYKLWGHTLTEERDHRLNGQANPQRRGHVTRALQRELANA